MNSPHLLYRLLGYGHYHYLADQTPEAIKEHLQQLVLIEAGYFNYLKKPNLKVTFPDQAGMFILTPRHWMMHYRGAEPEPAMLEGTLTVVNERQTQIQVYLRPNTVYIIMLILWVPVSVLITVLFFCNQSQPVMIFPGQLLWLVLIISGARMATGRLKRNFEQYLSLEPAP